MKKHFILITFLLFLIACQDEDFNTPDYSQKIVVDGWIEQGQPARVFLTLSAPYFSDIDSASLRDLVLTHAKVTVSDGTNEEILTLRKNSDYFPPYIYEGTLLRGVVGHTYSLKVELSGNTVTSTTTIPPIQKLDSIWYHQLEKIDTSGYISIKFTDEPHTDNFYRFLTKTGNKTQKYSPVFLPDLDGRLIDGQQITLNITKEKNKEPLYFNQNDTVFVKICTIDLPVFKFWSSLYNELINTQNPFASSNSHVISNVNGGLGVWAGYGVSTYRIICK